MKRRTPYRDLPLLPWLIAETVYEQTPVSSMADRETSLHLSQRDEFSKYCDLRCKRAYAKKAAWFERLVTATDNSGRDGLYDKVRLWLQEYKEAPAKFKRDTK